MLREGVILSGEQRIRKEFSELSLQKEAELNPRGGNSWHQRILQSERAAQAKVQSCDDGECLFLNSENSGVAGVHPVLPICTVFGFC